MSETGQSSQKRLGVEEGDRLGRSLPVLGCSLLSLTDSAEILLL